MAKPTFIVRQFLTKGSGTSNMTFPAVTGLVAGDQQLLAVGNFQGISVSTPTGWTLLGTYSTTTFTRLTLFTRVLDATTAANGFVIPSVNDYTAAEVRTFRDAVSISVVASGSGATTNPVTVPAASTLVHYWSASFDNNLSQQQGTITPAPGLGDATDAYTMAWFAGLVGGNDPTFPEAPAPARTATRPATASIQWATVRVTGTVDTAISLVNKIDAFAARVRNQFNNLTLNKLVDVDTATTAPTSGQTLVYDSTNFIWKPGTITGGGSGAFTPVQLTVSKTSGTQTIGANSFTTVDLGSPSVNTGGGSYSAGLWTVPTTGRYLIMANIRSADSITARSLAISVHTSNADGAWVTWTSFGGTGSFSRNNASYQRVDTFTAGDVLRLFVYSDSVSVDVNSGKLTIDRIG